MRENCTHGSEGGVGERLSLPLSKKYAFRVIFTLTIMVVATTPEDENRHCRRSGPRIGVRGMLGRDNSGGSPFDRPIAALARPASLAAPGKNVRYRERAVAGKPAPTKKYAFRVIFTLIPGRHAAKRQGHWRLLRSAR